MASARSSDPLWLPDSSATMTGSTSLPIRRLPKFTVALVKSRECTCVPAIQKRRDIFHYRQRGADRIDRVDSVPGRAGCLRLVVVETTSAFLVARGRSGFRLNTHRQHCDRVGW